MMHENQKLNSSQSSNMSVENSLKQAIQHLHENKLQDLTSRIAAIRSGLEPSTPAESTASPAETSSGLYQWQKIQEEIEKHKAKCPHCGYCPTCGRGPYTFPSYPVYPTYPTYPGIQPWITYCNQTIDVN